MELCRKVIENVIKRGRVCQQVCKGRLSNIIVMSISNLAFFVGQPIPQVYYFMKLSNLFIFSSPKVSDVNDDVRRAAVTGLGFLLFR